MPIRVLAARGYVVLMRTRLPFRFGITTMTELPLFMLECDVELDGQRARGRAFDGLAPKWFVKDPTTSIEADRVATLAAIELSCAIAIEAPPAATVFEFWRVHDAAVRSVRPDREALLVSFAISLVERCLIDAFCRTSGLGLREALTTDGLGLEFDGPGRPNRDSVAVRHTVGMRDALTSAGGERPDVDDGLPATLEEAIDRYALTHFKIKLSGDIEWDVERVSSVLSVVESTASDSWRFSLDGNESFQTIESFRSLWNQLGSHTISSQYLGRLLFVEQPIRRGEALTARVATALERWDDHPPVTIDESDDSPTTFRRALDLGYSGTSHKNCKGVFKSVLSAKLLADVEKSGGERRFLTSEDLTTVGPALLQDLAVVDVLGISHSERNGHHYFRGLTMFAPRLQADVAAAHPDLFAQRDGLTSLRIERGDLVLASVRQAPFGVALDVTASDLGARQVLSLGSV